MQASDFVAVLLVLAAAWARGRLRAALDPADAYILRSARSIADLSTDAAALLRQLPGVVEVEAPSFTRR